MDPLGHDTNINNHGRHTCVDALASFTESRRELESEAAHDRRVLAIQCTAKLHARLSASTAPSQCVGRTWLLPYHSGGHLLNAYRKHAR